MKIVKTLPLEQGLKFPTFGLNLLIFSHSIISLLEKSVDYYNRKESRNVRI